ncbi:AI-2E family transporter, partial [Curtobacterium sp. B18]
MHLPRKRDAPQDQDDHGPTPNVTFEVTRGGTGVRVNAFRIGFMGALGVLVAVVAGAIVNELSTVLVYVGVALFLALGIDPLVSFLERFVPRWVAITVVVVGVLAAFAGVVFAVVPILVQQATNLIQNFPEIVRDVSRQEWVQDLSQQFAGSFDIDHALQSLQSFVEDPGNLLSLGGGILAVGSGIL